jgi:hypothetical protein
VPGSHSHAGPGSPTWAGWLFGLLVLAGLALRGVAAAHSCGIAHPDEHQQYLEQAQGLAFGGPAQRFWEQERGMRNLLYPQALAAVLVLADRSGLRDPFAQAAALRFALAASAFLLIAWQAGRDLRRGHPVRAIALASLAALSTGVIYVHIRLLSENAMTIPLVLALLCLGRRPALAGAWLGVMLAVRLQSAFLALGFLLVALGDDLRSGRSPLVDPRKMNSVRMGAGLLFSAGLAVGLLDRVTLGGWFHSALENVRAQVVEGRAADWGVEPWYYYLGRLAILWRASPLAPLLLLVGAVKEWRLAVAAALMVAGHSAIDHKEFRFVWGLLPIALVLAARGVEVTWGWLGPRSGRPWIMALAASFALGSVEGLRDLEWNSEPYRSSATALAAIGQRGDVTGVAVCGVPMWECGNYYFLRKRVPLLFRKPDELRAAPTLAGGTINYLVLPRSAAASFKPRELQMTAECGDLLACRFRSYQGPPQEERPAR